MRYPCKSDLQDSERPFLSFVATEIFVTALILVLVACTVIIRRDLTSHGAFDALNPGLALLCYYVLYNFTAYVTHWDFYEYGSRLYAELAWLGLAGIVAGTFLAYWFCPTRTEVIPSRIVPLRTVTIGAFVMVVVSLAAIFVMYQQNVGLSQLLQGKAMLRQKGKSGILSGAFQTFAIGGGICLAGIFCLRGRFRWILLAAVAGIFALFFVLFASRGELLLALLLAAYLIHYNFRRIRWQVIILFLVAAAAGVHLMGLARAGIEYGWEGMIEITQRDAGKFMTRLDTVEFYQVNVRSMELAADGPPEGKLLLGSSYLSTVLILPPAVFSPWQRPDTLDRWYVKTYDPKIYERGGGWGFAPLVEAYFNFGYLGCVVIPGLIAFIINYIHCQSRRRAPGSLLAFANCLLACGLYEFMRGSFANIFKTIVFTGVLPGILLVYLCICLSGDSGRSDWREGGEA